MGTIHDMRHLGMQRRGSSRLADPASRAIDHTVHAPMLSAFSLSATLSCSYTEK